MSRLVPRRKQCQSQPLHIKIKAIKELNDGIPRSVIASKLDVHPTTVLTWKKNEHKLNKWQDNINENMDGGVPLKKKRLRPLTNELVDKETWTWFKERRAVGAPVNGSMIRAQAKYFHATLGGSEKFEASVGWLNRWKDRHNIRLGTSCESLSVEKDDMAVDNFSISIAECVKTENLSKKRKLSCETTSDNSRKLRRTIALGESVADAPARKVINDKKIISVMIYVAKRVLTTLTFMLVIINNYGREPRCWFDRNVKVLAMCICYYDTTK